MVGKCLYLSEADLILKPKTNVIIYNWGYYWDQHLIPGVDMEYRISYLAMYSYKGHYVVLGSRMAREGYLVKTCSTDGTSRPRTKYIYAQAYSLIMVGVIKYHINQWNNIMVII